VKVVFQNAAGPQLAARLAALDGLEVTACAESDEAQFSALMKDAEVVWHVLKPITASVIAGAPRLRLIQKIGVGVNTIDLDVAAERGIAVCNLPGTNTQAVAEMTLLLMLAALRRLPQLDVATRAGTGWSLDPSIQDALGELSGRVVGLVGYGAVPRALAPVLRAMGCDLLYTARERKPDALGRYVTLNELLAASDLVSLHVPLTPETAGMIDAVAIARMKRGAVLVNTARGGLVDQVVLTRALSEGRLGAAGLDVFADEPVDTSDPLFRLENVVVAPHVAWLTHRTFERSLVVAAENCRRLRAGEPLLYRVR
jgi:phosphoglycerate dehydrogenase-like enzyme